MLELSKNIKTNLEKRDVNYFNIYVK